MRRVDGASFLAQNAAKRSITLDLKDERGRLAFRQLVERWEESGSGARNKGPVPRDQLAAYTGPPQRHLDPPQT